MPKITKRTGKGKRELLKDRGLEKVPKTRKFIIKDL